MPTPLSRIHIEMCIRDRSALYVVNVQYASRSLYAELDQARSAAHRLTVESGRLQVENRPQSTPVRVGQLARSRWPRRCPNPTITASVAYTAQVSTETATPRDPRKPAGPP